MEATLLKLMLQRFKALYFRTYQDGTGIYLWPPEHMGMVQVFTFGHQNTEIDWQGIEIVPVNKDFLCEHPNVEASGRIAGRTCPYASCTSQ